MNRTQIASGTARIASIFFLIVACCAWGEEQPISLDIQWGKVLLVSKSTPTLQVVVNPLLRRDSPIHDGAFSAVKDLGAEYVRYVPWLPYPKLAVAELQPPTKTSTSWDFSLIDPLTTDFLDATSGHTTVMNFSTIPAWLFKTDKPVTYPDDPNQVDWKYTQGTELRDPSGKELAAYYKRLVSWYTQGGFTDENGVRHDSGHHYSFPIWEVLNEVDFEHTMTPQQYTARYDAIVTGIRSVSPQTKFMGMALALPSLAPEYFEYFLDPHHHKPGIPLDYISYHFYASPTPDQNIDNWQFTFFDQADRFLTTVRYVEEIRKRLSPTTKTDTDELGVILPNENQPNAIPAGYWNLAGALFAHLYIDLETGNRHRRGVQLVGYPTQFPSVTMVDWKSGKPNARFWVLRLLKQNFHPGDKLVTTKLSSDSEVDAQAFLTPAGEKILLVNKRNHEVEIKLPGKPQEATIQTVDEATGETPARRSEWDGGSLRLAPFAVAVVTVKSGSSH